MLYKHLACLSTEEDLERLPYVLHREPVGDDLSEIRQIVAEYLQVGAELVVAEVLATKHGAFWCDQIPRDVEAQALPVSRTNKHPTLREDIQIRLSGRALPTRVDRKIHLIEAVFFETLGQSLLPEVNHFAAETPREIEPVRGEVGDHDDDLTSSTS
jgi:hypothetical protein